MKRTLPIHYLLMLRQAYLHKTFAFHQAPRRPTTGAIDRVFANRPKMLSI